MDLSILYVKGSQVKTCLKRPLIKNTKIGFQDGLLLNAGQKYCRMLQWEHSAILSTFIKLPFSIKTFVVSIFKWPLKTDFTVFLSLKILFILANSADLDKMRPYKGGISSGSSFIAKVPVDWYPE